MIVFTDEEGGTIGSRALAGGLDEHVLEAVSQSGKTIRGGISFLGGDPGKLAAVVRPKGSITAYLELHIEQGQILESKKVDIGVVEGIVGIGRWEVTVEGFANHAGTTPMDQRQDALLAAADLILAVNRVVRKAPGCQVGTVGRIKAEPGAVNVVPGRVVMSLELRDLSLEKIRTLLQEIQEEAERISEYSRTKISFAPIDELTLPAFSDPAISRLIQLSAEELGLATLTMPSGAGHDAQNISKIAPMGMIFIPSLGGVSHSPQEFSRPGDIIAGANVLLQTLLKIDRNGR
jgi:N-carbamoyl-L-amino-acid hydrolase